MHSPELIYFDQAATKNFFIDPVVADPGKVTLDTAHGKLSTIRAGARAKVSQVDDLLNQGKNQEAFLEAEKVIKVGSNIANSQSPLIYYLVGVTVSKMGWDEMDKIPISSLQTDFRAVHLATLTKYKDTRTGLKNVLKFEYITGTNALSSGDIKDLTDKYQTTFVSGQMKLLPNKTKKLLAEAYLQWIDQLNGQCPIAFKATHYSPSKLTVYFTENSVGKFITDMLTTALSTVPNKMCDLETSADKVLNKLK